MSDGSASSRLLIRGLGVQPRPQKIGMQAGGTARFFGRHWLLYAADSVRERLDPTVRLRRCEMTRLARINHTCSVVIRAVDATGEIVDPVDTVFL